MSQTLSTNDEAEQGAGGHEAHGIKRYVVVWLALLVGTVVTVVTGRIDMGAANIGIALLIATTKATLVVLFFMHLYDAGGVNRLVFVVSVLFLLVLIAGVFGDLMDRLPVTLPHGGPVPHVQLPSSPVPPAAPGGH